LNGILKNYIYFFIEQQGKTAKNLLQRRAYGKSIIKLSAQNCDIYFVINMLSFSIGLFWPSLLKK